MRMKSFVFLFLFGFAVVSVFSATTMNSGSGSRCKPSMAFKSWQVGRSPVGSNINHIVHTSFITSTETECRFKASVGYQGVTNHRGVSLRLSLQR
jgi:hypothetical protein